MLLFDKHRLIYLYTKIKIQRYFLIDYLQMHQFNRKKLTKNNMK